MPETLQKRFERNKTIIERTEDPNERVHRLGSALDFFNLTSRAAEAGDTQLIDTIRTYLCTRLDEAIKEREGK